MKSTPCGLGKGWNYCSNNAIKNGSSGWISALGGEQDLAARQAQVALVQVEAGGVSGLVQGFGVEVIGGAGGVGDDPIGLAQGARMARWGKKHREEQVLQRRKAGMDADQGLGKVVQRQVGEDGEGDGMGDGGRHARKAEIGILHQMGGVQAGGIGQFACVAALVSTGEPLTEDLTTNDFVVPFN